MSIGREEYEERYGERVIYCTRHKMSGIDGCIACDEERENIEMITCVTCNYKSNEKEDFVIVTLKETVLDTSVCQGCYDNYTMEAEAVKYKQKEAIVAQATAFANSINTDYFE